MRKILFTTPVLEHPAAGGPQLRIENSIKALNGICQLHLVSRVSFVKIGLERADKFYSKNSYKFFYSPSVKNYYKNLLFYKIKKFIKLFFYKDKEYCFDDYLVDIDVDFILSYANKNSIDVIWFGYGNESYEVIKKIRQKNSKLILICDTDSVLSRYLSRGLPFEKSPNLYKKLEHAAKKQEKEEIELCNMCEVTTAVSMVDKEYYQELINSKKNIKIFSNVVDLNSYSQYFTCPDNLKKPAIFLAGSFGPDSPMDKAARWFINDIFPLIKKMLPEVHFYIIGKGSQTTLFDISDESISVVGKVDSVLPYLKNSDVALVPLKFESGTRFKILEAGACGVPIVSTTLGAEGLNVTNGKDILIADEPQDFAQAVLKLIKDKEFANEIALNAKKLIQDEYGIDQLKKEALVIFSDFSRAEKDSKGNRCNQ